MESSIDIDDSFDTNPRGAAAAAKRAAPASTGYQPSASYGHGRRSMRTPSPESSEVDVSLSGSGSMDAPAASYANPRRNSAISSSASAGAARPTTGRGTPAAFSSSRMQPSSSAGARRYTDADSSLEDLNPENDEDSYTGYKPSSDANVSAHELLAQRAAAITAAQKHLRAAPVASRRPAAAAAAHDDNEVEIDVEESDPDVRASNNTLIQKAQAIQAANEAAEKRERQEQERIRKAEAEAKQKANVAAAAAAAEKERIRLREEEEDRREREQAERDREALRAAAEVPDEDDYSTEAFVVPETTASAAAPSKQPPTGLEALDAVLADDDDAEIERQRRELEAQEEAEMAAERKQEQSSADSLRLSNSDPQLLNTAAFMHRNFAGPFASPSNAAAGAGARSSLSREESVDLDIARRRQEAQEEEEEEQRRRAELAAKQRQMAQAQAAAANDRRASLEAAVEDSYDDDEDSASSRGRSRAASAATSTNTAAAAAASANPASAQASAAPAPLPPSVLASALATLNPAVSAQVFAAIQAQMAQPLQQQQPSQANPFATYNPSYTHVNSNPVFDPSASRAAAAQAWERLLSVQTPTPMHSLSAQRAVHPSPAPSLPQPPAAPVHVGSWEDMLAAASASSSSSQPAAPADRLFTKRPAPSSAASTAYPVHAPLYPPSATHYDFQSSGAMGRYINQVLGSGLAEEKARSQLRVENEREALRRLLTFNPYGSPVLDAAATAAGASPALSARVAEQKNLYLQDQAILNSVLRRVLAAGEARQASEKMRAENQLAFTPGHASGQDARGGSGGGSGGFKDDGRPLEANDVIRLIEEGYPHAAYATWKNLSANTLARSVLLAAEPPSVLYTRNVVESTLNETLSELLSDPQIIAMCKKATLKKLKHRLQFQKPLESLAKQVHIREREQQQQQHAHRAQPHC